MSDKPKFPAADAEVAFLRYVIEAGSYDQEDVHLLREYVASEVARATAELRADKARLDWLCSDNGARWLNWHLVPHTPTRAMIDAAIIDPSARAKGTP